MGDAPSLARRAEASSDYEDRGACEARAAARSRPSRNSEAIAPFARLDENLSSLVERMVQVNLQRAVAGQQLRGALQASAIRLLGAAPSLIFPVRKTPPQRPRRMPLASA